MVHHCETCMLRVGGKNYWKCIQPLLLFENLSRLKIKKLSIVKVNSSSTIIRDDNSY